MKTSNKLAILSILFLFLTASSATFAADDGNTKPRLTNNAVSSGTADVINETSVSGNVKGVSCALSGGIAKVIFTVNGAATQTIDMPVGFLDSNGDRQTGWIPMNIRFTSSIRVQIQNTGGSSQLNCDVSWALD